MRRQRELIDLDAIHPRRECQTRVVELFLDGLILRGEFPRRHS